MKRILTLPFRWLLKVAIKAIFNYKQNTVILNNIDHTAREHAIKLLDKFTPYAEVGHYPPVRVKLKDGKLSGPDFPVVIGFNHPSLGEIPRLVSYCFKYYPEKKIFFPVAWHWYEILVSVADGLSRLGIIMTPLITPHVMAKMEKKYRKSPEKLQELNILRNQLQFRYLKMCKQMAEMDNIILVAPSAKRQRTIFPDEASFHGEKPLPKVMHLMAKVTGSRAYFLPVCVIPPNHFFRTINFFRPYTLMPAEYFTPDLVKDHYEARDFDFNFMTRLLMYPAQDLWYPREN